MSADEPCKTAVRFRAGPPHKDGKAKGLPVLRGGIDERARSAWGQEAGNAGERSAVGPPEAARAGIERKGFGKAGAKDPVRDHHIKRKFDEIFLVKAAPFCVDKCKKI